MNRTIKSVNRIMATLNSIADMGMNTFTSAEYKDIKTRNMASLNTLRKCGVLEVVNVETFVREVQTDAKWVEGMFSDNGTYLCDFIAYKWYPAVRKMAEIANNGNPPTHKTVLMGGGPMKLELKKYTYAVNDELVQAFLDRKAYRLNNILENNKRKLSVLQDEIDTLENLVQATFA